MKFTVFSSLFLSFLALSAEAKSSSKSKHHSNKHHKAHNVAPELQGPTAYNAPKSAKDQTSYSSTTPTGDFKDVFLPRGYIVEFENDESVKKAAAKGKREVSFWGERWGQRAGIEYVEDEKLLVRLLFRRDNPQLVILSNRQFPIRDLNASAEASRRSPVPVKRLERGPFFPFASLQIPC